MNKIQKILSVFILLGIGFLSTVHVVDAEVPYKTFTVDGDGDFVETQTAYVPEKRLTQFDEHLLKQPEDFKLFQEKMYITDTGNGRIVISDLNGEKVNIIGEGYLMKPVGIDVVDSGIYVADEGLAQVIQFGFNGELKHVFERPNHPSFGKSAPFTPIKVTVDDRENVYVISRGNSNGLIQLNKNTNNEFLGYFAPNKTKISLLTSFRRLIFTEEQLSRMLNIIPNSPVNLTIDDDGLIYTITPQDDREVVKKLNMAGKNIIKRTIPDRLMAGLAVGPYENIFTISSNGYIYEYNREGNLLFVFGGKDAGLQRLGLFSQTSAIAVDDRNSIYVLDQNKGEIQVFGSTEFADKVHEALLLYQDGNYIESKEIWEEVLKVNSLFDFANLGMGEAHFKEENYAEALESYKLSRNVSGYSDAYWELRNVWIRENILQGMGILIGIIVIIKGFKFYTRKRPIKFLEEIKYKFSNNKLVQEIKYAGYFMKHPIDGSYGIKREGRTSNLSSMIILVAALMIWVLSKYFTGFIFSTVKAGEYSVFTDLLLAFVIFIFVTTATYLVSTINDGESTYKQLMHGFIYSLTPFIIFQPIRVWISNYLTLNEAFIMQFSSVIILVWVLTLIFISIKELNNYEIKETIKIILLSIFTLFIGVLILFVLYLLFNQLFSFIESVLREAVYRIEKG